MNKNHLTPFFQSLEESEKQGSFCICLVRDVFDELATNWPDTDDLESLTGEAPESVSDTVIGILSDWRENVYVHPGYLVNPPSYHVKELARHHCELIRLGKSKQPEKAIELAFSYLEHCHTYLLNEQNEIREQLAAFARPSNADLIKKLDKLQSQLSQANEHLSQAFDLMEGSELAILIGGNKYDALGLCEHALSLKRAKFSPWFNDLESLLMELDRVKSHCGQYKNDEEFKAYCNKLRINISRCFQAANSVLDNLTKNKAK
jgi:hypothetical protein